MPSSTEVLVASMYVKIGGSEVSADFMAAAVRIEVESSLFIPAMATIDIYDPKLAWIDNSLIDIGKELEVSVKANTRGGLEQQAEVPIFKGLITAIEPDFNEEMYATVRVRAYDRSYLLHRGTESATYLQSTDSDIASKIIGGAGLRAAVESTTVTHQHVFREDLSDYEFLTRLARRNGFVVWCDDRTINFKPPESIAPSEVALEFGVSLMEFHPALTITGQVNGVTVQGWDRQAKQAVTGQSKALSSAEIGVAKRGPAIAQSAVSASKKLHLAYIPEAVADAEKLASSLMNRIGAGDVTGEGRALGDPDIKPGCKVRLTGLGTRFSGKYFVTRVRHVYDPEDAYYTEFSVGGSTAGTVSSLLHDDPVRPLSSPAPMNGFIPAIVTNNNDPDKMGRVKIKYPTIADDKESGWAPVISAGAGANRGFMVLPEVNDEVVVGFAHGDLNRPYVVGGVWNGQDAMPTAQNKAVVNGKVEVRELKTRAGHVLRFTDTSGSEMIELNDKSSKNYIKIESSSNTITIEAGGNINVTAKGNVKVKATGSASVEATQDASLKGVNVNVEASAKLALKGAMVDVTSSGPVKISGATVMIN